MQDRYHSVTDHNREAFLPHVYELHGNMNFMHCSNEEAEHSHRLVRVPPLEVFDQAISEAP